GPHRPADIAEDDDLPPSSTGTGTDQPERLEPGATRGGDARPHVDATGVAFDPAAGAAGRPSDPGLLDPRFEQCEPCGVEVVESLVGDLRQRTRDLAAGPVGRPLPLRRFDDGPRDPWDVLADRSILHATRCVRGGRRACAVVLGSGAAG